jgi:hypothetical protein
VAGLFTTKWLNGNRSMIDQLRAQAAAAIEAFRSSSGQPRLLIEIRALQDRIWKIKRRNPFRDDGSSAFSWVDNWDPPAGVH